jgi:hypothetical protein
MATKFIDCSVDGIDQAWLFQQRRIHGCCPPVPKSAMLEVGVRVAMPSGTPVKRAGAAHL